MKNLSAALILEKNKLATPNPWLTTLDIVLPDATAFYLVNNTEDVSFQGRTYVKFPFELDAARMSSKGEIPTLALRVSNVTRILEGYVEEQNGMAGAVITVRIVNAGHLAEDYAEIEMTFDVLSATSDAQWISLDLGAPNPLSSAFPPKRFMAESCNWSFRSVECGYSGPSSFCKRTLDYCRQLGNSPRFGGFPGLSTKGVRLA